MKKIKLPTFEETVELFNNDEKMTDLEKFVNEYEPADETQAKWFRDDLVKALNCVAKENKLEIEYFN